MNFINGINHHLLWNFYFIIHAYFTKGPRKKTKKYHVARDGILMQKKFLLKKKKKKKKKQAKT